MAPPPQKKSRTSSDKLPSRGGAVAASELDLEVQQLKLTDLPTSLLVANIYPYLNIRKDWNSFSVVNTDIHDSIESYDAFIPPWPENCALSVPRVDCDLESPVWSPDGRNIACHDGFRIHIFDQCRGHINDWKAHDCRMSSFVYSPDGQLLVSGGHDGHVKIWDRSKEYKCIQDWKIDKRGCGVAVSPDSKLAAVITCERAALLRVADGSAANSCALAMPHICNVMFSPDGHFVIFGGYETGGVIKVWRIDRDSDNLISVDTESSPVCSLSMSADGSSIASAGYSNIKLWKRADEGLECIRTFQGPRGYSYPSVSFSNDDNFLVVGYRDGRIHFLMVEDGTCSRVYQSAGVIQALKYSPDGSRLLVQDEKGVHLKSLCPVQNKEGGP